MSNYAPDNIRRGLSSSGSIEYWLIDENRQLSGLEVNQLFNSGLLPLSGSHLSRGGVVSGPTTTQVNWNIAHSVPINMMSGKMRPTRQGPAGFNADRELVVGEVLGARVWDLDHLGRLVGVTYKEVMKPGDNPGVCGAHADGMPGHSLATCSCGFHAYFAGQELTFGGTVCGIIAGSGETVIGSKGFRSKRARLVALTVEGSAEEFNVPETSTEPESEPQLLHQRPTYKSLLARVLPRRQALHYMSRGPAGLLIRLSAVLGAVVFSTMASVGLYALASLGLLSVLWGLTAMMTDDSDWRRPRKFPVPKSAPGSIDASAELQATSRALLLSTLYPDVPIYSSIEKMLRNHKLSSADDFRAPAPPVPTPQNTDNFWELP